MIQALASEGERVRPYGGLTATFEKSFHSFGQKLTANVPSAVENTKCKGVAGEEGW